MSRKYVIPSTGPSSFALLAWLVAWVTAVPAVFLALGFAWVAVTATGRVCALVLGSGAVCWVSIAHLWVRGARRWRYSVFLAAVSCAVSVFWLVSNRSEGAGATNARVFEFRAGEQLTGPRRGVCDLVPEVDQLMVAFTVMPMVDRLFTVGQATRLKAWTASIYRESDGDPGFRSLGSAMPEMYGDLLFGNADAANGRVFVYLPSGVDVESPQRVLVFLHGSGGNFRAYLWLLSRMAERAKVVVVAPTFGLGNWRYPDASNAFDRALREAAKVCAVDRTQVHLLGLSNGGLGVGQLARWQAASVRSVVWLSPVLDRSVVSTSEFAHQWRGRRILFLTGGVDDRIPVQAVNRVVRELEAGGVLVTEEVVPDADHFLFFSHRQLVEEQLVGWLAEFGR